MSLLPLWSLPIEHFHLHSNVPVPKQKRNLYLRQQKGNKVLNGKGDTTNPPPPVFKSRLLQQAFHIAMYNVHLNSHSSLPILIVKVFKDLEIIPVTLIFLLVQLDHLILETLRTTVISTAHSYVTSNLWFQFHGKTMLQRSVFLDL